MTTHRGMSALFLAIVFVVVGCSRGGNEPAASAKATPAAESQKSEAAAVTTTAPTYSDLPDPFEMTAPPPPADPNGPCVLSTKLGSDGSVAGAEVSFAKTDPIHVTVRWKDPVPELNVEIVDHMGKRLKTFSAPLKGRSVTYSLGTMPHGRYRVISHGGGAGPHVCETAFEVR